MSAAACTTLTGRGRGDRHAEDAAHTRTVSLEACLTRPSATEPLTVFGNAFTPPVASAPTGGVISAMRAAGRVRG